MGVYVHIYIYIYLSIYLSIYQSTYLYIKQAVPMDVLGLVMPRRCQGKGVLLARRAFCQLD